MLTPAPPVRIWFHKLFANLAIGWMIVLLIGALFPLWATGTNLGIMDWNSLSFAPSDLSWASVLPNAVDRFAHASYVYRPFALLSLHIRMIVADGQWWVLYGFMILDIVNCALLLLLIGRHLKVGRLGTCTMLATFLLSNKPQLEDPFEDVFLITAVGLLSIYVILRFTEMAQKGISRRGRHLGYLGIASVLAIATFFREYMVALVIPCIIVVHFYARGRRDHFAHGYLLIAWMAQAWMLAQLTVFAAARGLDPDPRLFVERGRTFLAFLMPMRIDGPVSWVIAGLLLLGITIALVRALRDLPAFVSGEPLARLAVLLGAFFVGALGIVALVAIPNPQPAWGRYVVLSSTIVLLVAVYGLRQMPNRLLTLSSLAAIVVVLAPLLALPDRFHNTSMYAHYLRAYNTFLRTVVDLQQAKATLYLDDRLIKGEHIVSVDRLFRQMGAYYYGLTLNPIEFASTARIDPRKEYYVIVESRGGIDYSYFERQYPGSHLEALTGAVSDQPFGIDYAAAFWTGVGRVLGQRGDPVGDFFWPAIARNPGYYLARMTPQEAYAEVVPTHAFDVSLVAPLPVVVGGRYNLLSAEFQAPATGWYFICRGPGMKAGADDFLLLLLAGNQVASTMKQFVRGYDGSLVGEPVSLIGGQTNRLALWAAPGVSARPVGGGEEHLRFCPLEVVRPMSDYGALF